MKPYDPKTIEEKWLERWEQEQLFQGTVGRFQKSDISHQDSASELKADSRELTAEKFYALFAFAYPSGSGLHVGHVESKTALDILVRHLRMTGKDAFFPVGWDAFGLPAENYAIKTGIHPSVTTKNAIDTFRRQIKRLGISYDWKTELATCHPEYYKWTQWIFIQLFKAGLAYRDKGWVNWCPQDKTVLANEQVVNGECERCGAAVVQKELEQWKFRITAYKDELLSGLDQVDWPKATKTQQENWIGKSKGLQIKFQISNSKFQTNDKTQIPKELSVWTKFWETVYGVTFVVIAPERFKEYQLIDLVPEENRQQVLEYLDLAFHKTEEQRRVGEKDKTGVDTGIKLGHPLTGEEIPLWIADYVLMNVGTGVVMGVPSHDERDFAFAKKFSIPLIQVVSYEDKDIDAKVANFSMPYEGEGKLIHSGKFDGMDAWGEGKSLMADWMIAQGYAEWKTTYKLRDWLISRQRYWGAPIPMVFCDSCFQQGKGYFSQTNLEESSKDQVASSKEKNKIKTLTTNYILHATDAMPGWFPVPEAELPVRLPDITDFTPTDDGHSPLEKADESWLFTKCPGCGGRAKREVDTMDTFVDSSWYFLRYGTVGLERLLESRENNQRSTINDQQTLNVKTLKRSLEVDNWKLEVANAGPFNIELTNTLMPVDLYLIGPEHIVLHLLYARFFTKFLRDQGYLSFDEPFMKMRHQGMILGPDGKKMSKSKGNVINPDEIIEKFGADALRVYEMFMGPLDADKAWDTNSLVGVYRFLSRIYALFQKNLEKIENGEWRMESEKKKENSALQQKLHWAIQKLSRDIPELKFNTSIAALMEFVNVWEKELTANSGQLTADELSVIPRLLAPFAPFLAEELWERLQATGHRPQGSVHLQAWPTYDPSLLEEDEIELAVQVNGKLKTRFTISKDASRDEIEAKAQTFVDGTPKKIIVVPRKLVNIVL